MQVFISRKDTEGKVTLGTLESREKEAKLFCFFFFLLTICSRFQRLTEELRLSFPASVMRLEVFWGPKV